jgi:hypothetical protein
MGEVTACVQPSGPACYGESASAPVARRADTPQLTANGVRRHEQVADRG